MKTVLSPTNLSAHPPILIAGDLGLEGLVSGPLAVHGLGGAVAVVLGADGLLLDPLSELLAVLQELVQLQLVTQTLHLQHSPLPGGERDAAVGQLRGHAKN